MAVETLSVSRKCRWRSGKRGRECRLNCSEIASGHGQADIHPVGMQGFEPAEAPPSFEDPFVFQECHQKILVIACQGDHRGWPFATCKSFDHAHGAKTAIHVVAQKNRHGIVERLSFHIGLDALGHFAGASRHDHEYRPRNTPESHPAHDAWSQPRWRFRKRLQERVCPPHEFGGPHLLG